MLRAIIWGSLEKRDRAAADLDAAKNLVGKGHAEMAELTRWIALARTSIAVWQEDPEGARKALPPPKV